jgi:hypothetical protein
MSDQGESQSSSIKDRIGAMLASQEQPQAPEPEAEVADGAEPSAAETQEVVTQEVQETEPDPTADWVEVELEGEKLTVPPKYREAFLKNADYTQKTQGLAEQRKVVELREQAIVAHEQVFQQLQPLYHQAAVIESQLQQLNSVNWEQLRAEDPLQYSTRRADYAALSQSRQEIHNQIGQGQQYLSQQRQYAAAEAAKAAEPILRKAIPDWGPDKDRKLTQFALTNGASAAELQGLAARPWAVILLEKARMFDELQASKAQLPKKVQHLSPVAKPGAKPTVQSTQGASFRKNQEAFRKSGGKDSIALRALIKARLSG